MPLALGVDFDGVLHTYDRGWHDGSIYGDWIPGAQEGLRELMSRYSVFILSSRDAQQIAVWIEATSDFRCVTRFPQQQRFWNHRGVLLVTDRKLPAFAYIDDRAILFTDWGMLLRNIREPGRFT